MATVEPGDDVVEGRCDLGLVEGEDAGQHRTRSRVLLVEALVAGDEQPRDDAARGRAADAVRARARDDVSERSVTPPR